MNTLRQLIHEIHRRSLWQVLGIYAIASWAVLGGVGTLGDALGLPDWFPRLALGLLIVGLPIVLATAIVQEGGPGRDRANSSGPELNGYTSPDRLLNWRNAIGGGVLALALWGIVAAGWLVLGDGGSAEVAEQSLAVLPFVNMSGDPENEYFSDGITEELRSALARLPSLRVPARTSSFAFKGMNIPIREIADMLGVSHVVEGSVRRAGDRVLVAAHLVDARSDTRLWSESYERELSDIFAIQREIGTSIADALEIRLVEEERAELVPVATTHADAYDLYLRGLEYWNRPGWQRPNFEAAVDLLGRAVALDPGFAPARAALSVAHSGMAWRGYGAYDRSPERLASALEHAREALRLRPRSAESHLAMAYVYYWGDYDLPRALEELDIAQRLAPQDVEIIEARGFVHRRLGNWAQVHAIFEEAVKLSPRDANLFHNLGGRTYDREGRHREAFVQYGRAIELAPDQVEWRWGQALARFYAEGELDSLRAVAGRLPRDDNKVAPNGEAFDEMYGRTYRIELAYLERDGALMLGLLSPAPGNLVRVGQAYVLLGNPAAAAAAFDSARVLLEAQVIEQPLAPGPLWDLGLSYGPLGRIDDARDVAARVIGFRGGDVYDSQLHRWFSAAILAQAGLAEEAVEILRMMSAAPFQSTRPGLQLHPVWDPIRDDPGFQDLVAGRDAG